jgi:hypothetical protein
MYDYLPRDERIQELARGLRSYAGRSQKPLAEHAREAAKWLETMLTDIRGWEREFGRQSPEPRP